MGQRERKKKREREKDRDLPSTSKFPKWPQCPGLGYYKVKNQEFHLVLLNSRDPLGHFLILSQVHQQGMSQKWRSWDSKGVHMDAGITGSSLNPLCHNATSLRCIAYLIPKRYRSSKSSSLWITAQYQNMISINVYAIIC